MELVGVGCIETDTKGRKRNGRKESIMGTHLENA